MLKTFVKGLVFGTGFAVAMIAVSTLFGIMWVQWAIPESVLTGSRISDAEPVLENPRPAEIQPKRDNASQGMPNYSFFDKSGKYAEGIPDGGGILGMAVLPTEAEAPRPRTFQVWLTKTEMWKIHTAGTTVEIEKTSYPALDQSSPSLAVFSVLGSGPERSSITLSARSVELLRRGEECDDDDRLNGELRITTEGVVFLMPDEIKR